MERRSKDFKDHLDLATECSMIFGLWNDDYSVPDYVIEMAKSVKSVKESKKNCSNCSNCACKNKGKNV